MLGTVGAGIDGMASEVIEAADLGTMIVMGSMVVVVLAALAAVLLLISLLPQLELAVAVVAVVVLLVAFPFSTLASAFYAV